MLWTKVLPQGRGDHLWMQETADIQIVGKALTQSI